MQNNLFQNLLNMIINTIKNFTGKAVVASLVACSMFSCSSESTDKTKETTDTTTTVETNTSKEPNIFYSDAIAFIDTLPKELNSKLEIDYKHQWEIDFKKPISSILDVIGFDFEKQISMSSFFDD